MAVLLIWNIVLSVKVSRLRNMLKRWTGDTSVQSFDQVMSAIQANQGRIQELQNEMQASVGKLNDKMVRVKGNVGVYRYNAFSETGSDLSFSVAMIDEQQNGVVLSGIRNREDSHIYAKPLAEGKSNYTLTPEEKEAIIRALQK
jgi:hypothetical protein